MLNEDRLVKLLKSRIIERYRNHIDGSNVDVRISSNYPEDSSLPRAVLHYVIDPQTIAWATGRNRVEALRNLLVEVMEHEGDEEVTRLHGHAKEEPTQQNGHVKEEPTQLDGHVKEEPTRDSAG